MVSEPTAEHLWVEVTPRGFSHMPPIQVEYGGSVRVYESSAAVSPHLWLAVMPDDNPEATAHLTLESAEHLRDQLTWLIENHYQVRARD